MKGIAYDVFFLWNGDGGRSLEHGAWIVGHNGMELVDKGQELNHKAAIVEQNIVRG